jgi:TRAP-type mannitol/chloroaromatic compound transport system permease small subunit
MDETGAPDIPRPLVLLARTIAVLGTLGVAALVVLVDTDVISRLTMRHPVAGVPELAALSIVCVVFLQAPWALAAQRMVRTEFMFGVVGRWGPRAVAYFEGFLAVLGGLLFAAVANAVYPVLLRHLRTGDTYGDPQVFQIAKWPTTTIVLVSSILLAIIYFSQAWAWFRHARRSPK